MRWPLKLTFFFMVTVLLGRKRCYWCRLVSCGRSKAYYYLSFLTPSTGEDGELGERVIIFERDVLDSFGLRKVPIFLLSIWVPFLVKLVLIPVGGLSSIRLSDLDLGGAIVAFFASML